MLSYERYLELGGQTDEYLFDENIKRAENYVNYYTFDRIKNPTRSVEEAIKEVVELLAEAQEELEKISEVGAIGEGVKSETSGSYKVDYVGTPRDDMFTREKYDKLLEAKVYGAIKRWLGLTGLMFRGGRL